jgi:hypothetical protein
MEKSKPAGMVWLEEYRNCGCSNVTEKKAEALGYCPIHGTDRQRITKVPAMVLGYVSG